VDLDSRLEELRALGLSEPEIVDLIHRELMRMAASRRAQETTAPPSPAVSIDAPGEVTPLVASDPDIALVEQDRVMPHEGDQCSSDAAESHMANLEHDAEAPSRVKSVPEGEPQLVIASMQQEHHLAAYSSFAGPMPPPHYARAYEALCPGFTDRNLAMLERESAAAIESRRLDQERLARGQWFALVSILAMMAVALVMVLLDQAVVAAGVMGTQMVALATVFLYREHKQRKALPPIRGQHSGSNSEPTQEQSSD
jgi:uncharacterized membrane protein